MKLIKITANIIGVFALLVGTSSCKDDEVAANECCTVSVLTYTWTACQDGTTTYKDGSGTTTTSNWKADYASWDLMKAEMITYGATCK